MNDRQRIRERLLSRDDVSLTDYVDMDLDKNVISIRLDKLLDFIEEQKQMVADDYSSWKHE